MKNKSLIICLAFLSITACHTAQTVQAPPASSSPAAKPAFISWDKKKLDIGTVKKGEKRSFHFEFTNTSGNDVQIEIVDACDCTTTDYPRGVIAPGAKARLDVIFNSAEKDADETIPINLIFKNLDAAGNPRIETVEYSFKLVK